MIKITAIYLILVTTYLLSNDFISKKELGSLIYQQPRGVSCSACHGSEGKGKVITTVKGRTVTAPSIRNASFTVIKKALQDKKSLMPLYNLTDSEIESLYFYLNSVPRRRGTE